jgi:hypothetical protein
MPHQGRRVIKRECAPKRTSANHSDGFTPYFAAIKKALTSRKKTGRSLHDERGG